MGLCPVQPNRAKEILWGLYLRDMGKGYCFFGHPSFVIPLSFHDHSFYFIRLERFQKFCSRWNIWFARASRQRRGLRRPLCRLCVTSWRWKSGGRSPQSKTSRNFSAGFQDFGHSFTEKRSILPAHYKLRGSTFYRNTSIFGYPPHRFFPR